MQKIIAYIVRYYNKLLICHKGISRVTLKIMYNVPAKGISNELFKMQNKTVNQISLTTSQQHSNMCFCY